MAATSPHPILGTEVNFVRDIDAVLDTVSSRSRGRGGGPSGGAQQDFVVAPLFHPRNRRDRETRARRLGPGTRSDTVMPSHDWISNVVGKISPYIDLDNSSEDVRRISEDAFREEFMWACHLGLQAIVTPPPRARAPNYARLLRQLCSRIVGQQQVWVRVPVVSPLDGRDRGGLRSQHQETQVQSNVDTTDGWAAWDALRHLCGHERHMFVALELTEDLPPDEGGVLDRVIARWAGEPIKAVFIHTSVFVTNQRGYPVLSRFHQRLLMKLLEFRIHVVLSGRPLHGTDGSHLQYFQYIQHLHSQLGKAAGDSLNSWVQPYNDYLQAPLQPLMDNLESQIYETFEKDPVKYDQYEKAIAKALRKLQRDDESQGLTDCTYIVTVVGAGRGPLVAAALMAASATGATVRVYAIEKNPNAVITLRNRVKTEAWSNVTVIAGDMRYRTAPELADIMVSELLGSWGDNELSPECLDGAQRFLKPPGRGISIPVSYTSFVAPVSAPKLWTYVREMPDKKGMDIPYVVRFHNSCQLAEDAPLFTFSHPSPLFDHEAQDPAEAIRKIDNSRFGEVTFVASQAGTVHGFTGTFESVLFDDVTLSIMPRTFSRGMFSWFPLFIPLTAPVRLEAGQTISACFWRCVDAKKVWYEWCVTAPVCSPIQNCNGDTYFIGL